jgi:uncharacterized cupredoxin-like copper-binding protein
MVALNPEHAPVEQEPLMSQSALGVLIGLGLIGTMGLGWTLARSTVGQPPFQFRPPVIGAPSAQTASQLHVVAADLKFDPKELRVEAPGQVKVHLENQGALEHDFNVEGVKGKAYAAGKKSGEGTLTFSKPGTYTFFCSFPGHRESGMVGTIVVGNGADGKASTTAKIEAPATSAAPHVSHDAVVSTQKAGNQLLEPKLVDGVKLFELTARAVQWEVLPGVFEEAWTYNDQLPGPIIRVTEGDKVRVTLKNQLPEETVLHFHGPRLPNAQDGVPDVTQKTIKVGETYTYEFTAEPAGTFVYHSHHNTAVQEPMGLYGVLIIDPKPGSAQAQRDAGYARDVVQVVSEFQGYYMVNGKAFPATEPIQAKVGEKVRLRLVNLGQTAHPMHLHGYHFKVVGTDGYPVLGEPLEKDTINIAPGERYDLEFVADNPGTWVFHCHILGHVTNKGVEPGGMITVIQVS